MEVLCLIPARGGSKSVPRKNIRQVGGRPLIAWSIAQAQAATKITRTIVTTDDDEIATVARRYGAETPFMRPAELATDDAVDYGFFRHALDWLAEHENYAPDLVVNLRPTMPVRRAATIDRAIQALADHPTADSLRSVTLSELSPYKMWRIGDDGLLVPVAPLEGVAEPYNQPRQQLPLAYWQDGYIDVVRARTVLEQNSATGRRVLPFVIDEVCADIDYEDEIAAAEALLALAEQDGGTPAGSPRAGRHPS